MQYADVSIDEYLAHRQPMPHLYDISPQLDPAAFELNGSGNGAGPDIVRLAAAIRTDGDRHTDVRLLAGDGEKYLATAMRIADNLRCDVYLTPLGADIRFVRESSAITGSSWEAIAVDRATGDPARWQLVRPADLPADVPTWFVSAQGRLHQNSGLVTVSLPAGVAFATKATFRDTVYVAARMKPGAGRVSTVAVNVDGGRFEIRRFDGAGSRLGGVELATLIGASLDVIHPDVQIPLTWPTDDEGCAALDLELVRLADALNRTIWVPEPPGAAFLLPDCGEFAAVDEVGGPSSWRAYTSRLAEDREPQYQTSIDGRLAPIGEVAATAFPGVPFASVPAGQMEQLRLWYESVVRWDGMFAIDLAVLGDGRLGVLLEDGTALAVSGRLLRTMLRRAGWAGEDLSVARPASGRILGRRARPRGAVGSSPHGRPLAPAARRPGLHPPRRSTGGRGARHLEAGVARRALLPPRGSGQRRHRGRAATRRAGRTAGVAERGGARRHHADAGGRRRHLQRRHSARDRDATHDRTEGPHGAGADGSGRRGPDADRRWPRTPCRAVATAGPGGEPARDRPLPLDAAGHRRASSRGSSRRRTCSCSRAGTRSGWPSIATTATCSGCTLPRSWPSTSPSTKPRRRGISGNGSATPAAPTCFRWPGCPSCGSPPDSTSTGTAGWHLAATSAPVPWRSGSTTPTTASPACPTRWCTGPTRVSGPACRPTWSCRTTWFRCRTCCIGASSRCHATSPPSTRVTGSWKLKIRRRRAIDVPATLDTLTGLPIVGRMHDFVGLDVLLSEEDLTMAVLTKAWRYGPNHRPVLTKLNGATLSDTILSGSWEYAETQREATPETQREATPETPA